MVPPGRGLYARSCSAPLGALDFTAMLLLARIRYRVSEIAYATREDPAEFESSPNSAQPIKESRAAIRPSLLLVKVVMLFLHMTPDEPQQNDPE